MANPTDTANAADPTSLPLLQVENLQTRISLPRGTVRAVDGVTFSLQKGEILGLVGESGSGKSMTLLSIMRLLEKNASASTTGKIELDGIDILGLPYRKFSRTYPGRKIGMVFQDPLTSLNPVYTVGDQVGAPLRYHGTITNPGRRRERVTELLKDVSIPSAETRLDEFPHQYSGGMRQRAVIATAIANNPDLLLADEPTSALDVTIQIQIIALLKRIRDDTGMGMLFVTHDLGVASALCDRIAVMYAGRIVEIGPVQQIYNAPAHPYTQALLSSIPKTGAGREERLPAIPGTPPNPLSLPDGCRFAPRCPHRMPRCDTAYPPTQTLPEGQDVSCWLFVDD